MPNYDENVEYLFRCFVTIDNIDDCKNFLEDLCTPSELSEMSRRIKAARMLREGYAYTEIASETNLSTATISRVNRCLKYGNNGYKNILDNIK